MNKKNTNVMTCGTAVITMTDGQVTTSIDQLASTLHRVFARNGHKAQSRVATSRA